MDCWFAAFMAQKSNDPEIQYSKIAEIHQSSF
jgi:hypothetical protein